MNGQGQRETRALAHVILVVVLTAFSIILIMLTLRKGWDGWVIPVFAVFTVTGLVLHITGLLEEHLRIYIYSAFIWLELFYYIANIEIIFNCTAIVIFVMLVILMTGEKKLVWITAAVGFLGMLLGFLNPENIGRLIWHTVVISASGHIMMRLQDSISKEIEELNIQIDALKQENKSADDFLTNVSHEIRTPVNVVIGLSGVCLDKEKDPEIKSNLNSISEAGKRVAEQINDILDYSEIEMNRLVVNPEEFMFSSLINDLVAELKPHMSKDIELVIYVDPNLPYIMKTDPIKLKRILWHVVVNAIKYTKEGGVYVSVTSTPQPYGINLCIDVTDTGIGMTREELERVYEHFYQSDSGRTRTESGLGLGMSVALGLVEALEGFIRLDSDIDAGTKAHICIPVQVVDSRPCLSIKDPDSLVIVACLHFEKFPDPNVREFYNTMVKNTVQNLKLKAHRVDNIDELKILGQNIKVTHVVVSEDLYMSDRKYMQELAKSATVIVMRRFQTATDDAPGIRMLDKPFYPLPVVSILNEDSHDKEAKKGKLHFKSVKALVVDDEPMNITVADNILRRYGINVIPARSGQEAIDICMNMLFDVIFMDHMMPGMDGIEAAKRIRSINPTGKRVPIVALTANAVSSAEEMFMKEGFDGFISKPIEIERLERVLRRVLPDHIRGENEEPVEVEVPEAAEPEPVEEAVNTAFEILESSGIDTGAAMEMCMNDEELYISIMAEYVGDSAEKKGDLEKFYKEKDWENFTIRIHSLKSSSKMIGALELSESARLLEEASRKNDEAYINDNYPEFLTSYDRVIRAITDAYGDGLFAYMEEMEL